MASLRSARSDARDLLKEARGLMKSHGKSLPAEGYSKVGKTQDELELAVKSNQPDLIVGLTRKLDEQLSAQFALVRKSPTRQYIESIGSAVLIALLLRLFVVEMYKIPSGSMYPTLYIGDHLFISKFLYGIRVPFVNKMLVRWGMPKRGDVIVFNSPVEGDKDLIKRVAGLPGDTIELRNQIVYVNGVQQPRALVADNFFYWDYDEKSESWYPSDHNQLYKEKLGDEMHQTLEELEPRNGHAALEGPYHVPPESLFMLGDNRDNSADSRYGGWTVPFGNIKGKAFIIVFSLGKGGWWFCHGDGFFCTESGIRTDRFFHLIP